MTEQTEMRMSEFLRLKPRPCRTCGGTEKPRPADASDADDATVDTKVVVAYYCTNRRCNNSSGW